MNALSYTPLVSIVMPTFNRAQLIAESIRSVVEQTYEHWELIIIDDGSTDDTRDVIEQFNDRRITCHFIEHTGLIGKIRNIGIKLSKGELIAFQDSDDIWLPDKLQIQLKSLWSHPEAAFVLCNNSQIGEYAVEVPDYKDTFVGKLFLPFLLKNQFHFCGTSFVFRREVLDSVGTLEESVRMMRELHFFLRISAHFTGIFLPDRLVKVRRHRGNTSSQYRVQSYKNLIIIVRDFRKQGLISWIDYKRLMARYEYQSGLCYDSERDSRAAPRFLRSWLHNPLNVKAFIRIGWSLISRIRAT